MGFTSGLEWLPLSSYWSEVLTSTTKWNEPHKNEMVEIDDNGKVRSIQIKSDRTELLYAWEIAILPPVFTRFMHDFVSARQGSCDEHKIGINQ